MKTELSNRYNNLANEVRETYNTLITTIPITYLVDEEIFEDEEDVYDQIEEFEDKTVKLSFLSNKDGSSYEAYVLIVSAKDGLYVAEENDTDVKKWVSFSDIDSLYEKIRLIEFLTN